jgi:hypothetical protein
MRAVPVHGKNTYHERKRRKNETHQHDEDQQQTKKGLTIGHLECLCVIRIKGRFFNYSLINIHAPTNDSEEEAKDQFYEQLERAYAACPSHDVKLVMRDANAKVGRKTVHQPTIGKHTLHESTNENGLRLVVFAAG